MKKSMRNGVVREFHACFCLIRLGKYVNTDREQLLSYIGKVAVMFINKKKKMDIDIVITFIASAIR